VYISLDRDGSLLNPAQLTQITLSNIDLQTWQFEPVE